MLFRVFIVIIIISFYLVHTFKTFSISLCLGWSMIQSKLQRIQLYNSNVPLIKGV